MTGNPTCACGHPRSDHQGSLAPHCHFVHWATYERGSGLCECTGYTVRSESEREQAMTIGSYGYDEDGNPGGWPGREMPSVSYRYGYQIGASKPRFVKQETRRDVAELAAREEAKRVQAKLKELGAPAGVSWWIQKRTTQASTTFEEPEIEAVQ